MDLIKTQRGVQLMNESSTMSCFSYVDKTNEVQTPSEEGETFDQLV